MDLERFAEHQVKATIAQVNPAMTMKKNIIAQCCWFRQMPPNSSQAQSIWHEAPGGIKTAVGSCVSWHPEVWLTPADTASVASSVCMALPGTKAVT
jgi:hypothetical protein